jgi:hypothetical protein
MGKGTTGVQDAVGKSERIDQVVGTATHSRPTAAAPGGQIGDEFRANNK